MKIISKVKEYYDYLQGIYGIDPLMVYDRRTDNLILPFDPNPAVLEIRDKLTGVSCDVFHRLTFAICNKEYVVFQYNSEFFHTPEQLLKLNALIQQRKDPIHIGNMLKIGGRYSWLDKPVRTIEDAKEYYENYNGRDTNVNKKFRQPVLIQRDRNSNEGYNYAIPYLTKFGFASFYPAERIYQEISTFLGWLRDYPEIPNKQTDIEKLQSHGFDKKVSFRHRK